MKTKSTEELCTYEKRTGVNEVFVQRLGVVDPDCLKPELFFFNSQKLYLQNNSNTTYNSYNNITN